MSASRLRTLPVPCRKQATVRRRCDDGAVFRWRRCAHAGDSISIALVLCLCGWLIAMPAAAAVQIELTLVGLEGELRSNALASLQLEERRRRPGLKAATIEELFAAGDREIATALEPFGYYQPVIESRLVPPAAGGQTWRAEYNVDPGPPLAIGRLCIDVDGAGCDAVAGVTALAHTSLREGQTLDHRRYEAAKQTLINAVVAEGFLDAGYREHRVEVDLDAYTATVYLALERGPRYVFGPVEFEQYRFAESYLQKFLVLEPGAPFNEAALARQRRELTRSGHFQEVNIQRLPPTGGDPPAIPVRILLDPYKANRYRGRLGWGTDTGLGVQLDWLRRHIGDRGHRFTLSGTVVEERNRLAGDFRYVIPIDPLERSRVELGARHESKDLTFDDVDLDEGGETRIATDLVSGQWFAPRRRWGDFTVDQRFGASWVTENYDVFEVLFGNLPDSSQQFIIDRIGQEAYRTLAPEFEALVPGYRLTLRRSDDRILIRDGDFFSLSLTGASQDLGSNIDFWQARLNSWHIRSPGERSRILLRAALGYSDAESRRVLGVNFNQLPEYYEFRAGGGRSVRGYGFETLFPEDALTGGKHQLIGSLEYEYSFLPDWGAAVFVDAGNAFNDFDDIDAKVGIGVGLRWRSPVGVARIDLGFPLDDADDAFQIYITVGPEF